MATQTLQTILVEIVSVERTGPSTGEFRHSETDPIHGRCQPTLGAPRVHGEIMKLGFEISERTVSRLMPRKDRKPSQTWTTFLRNHAGQIGSIDFFTVATIRLRVLYVFIALSHNRRRIVHFNVTEHPTAVWAAQQIVEAFPENSAPRSLVRDRDGIYGHYFIARVAGMGIEQVRTSPRSPWQNWYVERVIGSFVVHNKSSIGLTRFAGGPEQRLIPSWKIPS